MRALVWYGESKLSLEDLPEPEHPDGHVLFEPTLAGICGSDLHPYRGEHGPRRPPLVLGHEAIGSVAGREGRFVLDPIVSCGECRACRRGEDQLCERRGLVGLDRQGVFAERVVVEPTALVPVPEGTQDLAAVLVEPLATSVSALRLEGVDAATTLLVVGGGPVGLLAVHAAASAGAHVLAAEPLASRRELAARLGADEVVADAGEVPAGSVDVVIDAVGIEPTWLAGISAVRSGGSVCVIGLGQAEGAVPMADLVRRGVGVRGHFAYSRSDFEAALDILVRKPPPLDWLTVVGLDEGAEGFRRLVEEPAAVTKVLLDIAGTRA